MVATNGRSARQRQAERYSIGAVENALTLLGAIAERDVLGLGEAAEIAGVSKSTAYRLLATLEVAGLAERLPESGYRAGVEAVRWATRLLAGLDVRTVALPTLRRLREETGETVNLAILRDTSLVYVEILESPAAFRMADVPGRAVPDPRDGARQGRGRPPRAATARVHPRTGAVRAPHPEHADDVAGVQRAARTDPDDRATAWTWRRSRSAWPASGRRSSTAAGSWVRSSVSAPRARMTDARIEPGRASMVRTLADEVSQRLAPSSRRHLEVRDQPQVIARVEARIGR